MKRPVIGTIVLSLAALVSVAPLVWMLISATNTSADVAKGALWFGGALGDNLTGLLERGGLPRAFGNSLLLAAVTTAGALTVSSAAGYGFAMYPSRGRGAVFSALLLSMMIPFAAVMIPMFRLYASMGWLNSLAAVALPSFSTAFLIFFFRQNALSFPPELAQAARVDGLSEFGIFARVFVPTMRSTYAAAAIITFMNSWNAYLWPLVAIQTPENQTLPLYLSNLGASYTPDYGAEMCALLLATLPTAIVFFVMQRSFVEGMTGAVK